MVNQKFPEEETYSLVDQIRRSSRSVFACIAEAYKKRRYPNHFISKLSDSDMENAETQAWLDACKACGYLTEERMNELNQQSEEVSKLLNYMINNPTKFQ